MSNRLVSNHFNYTRTERVSVLMWPMLFLVSYDQIRPQGFYWFFKTLFMERKTLGGKRKNTFMFNFHRLTSHQLGSFKSAALFSISSFNYLIRVSIKGIAVIWRYSLYVLLLVALNWKRFL